MGEKMTKKERRIATDKAIFDAAVIEFGENGYSHTTLTAIAKRAGVSQGLVSQNFGNKNGLFLKVVENIDQLLFDYTDKELGGRSFTMNNLVSIILKRLNVMAKDNPAGFQLMFSLSSGVDIPAQCQARIAYRYKHSPAGKLFNEAVENGQLPKGSGFDFMHIFVQMAVTIVYFSVLSGMKHPDERYFLKAMHYKETAN